METLDYQKAINELWQTDFSELFVHVASGFLVSKVSEKENGEIITTGFTAFLNDARNNTIRMRFPASTFKSDFTKFDKDNSTLSICQGTGSLCTVILPPVLMRCNLTEYFYYHLIK